VESVPSTVTVGYLAHLLNLKEKSARKYLGELKLLGLVSEDGKLTVEANDWRFNADYCRVCSSLVTKIYPDEVRDLFPGPSIDRTKCAEWFTRELNVGTPTGSQYATTYILRCPVQAAYRDATHSVVQGSRGDGPDQGFKR
jgi:hypothetical protein